MGQVIDGEQIAKEFRNSLKVSVDNLSVQPCLAVIQVGNNPSSTVYINKKRECCKEVGVKDVFHHLDEDVSQKELLALIEQLNLDMTVHGILVQFPLPEQIDEKKIVETISPEKDVDGLHPHNVGKLLSGIDGLAPCTPQGVIHLIKSTGTTIAGKHAVVVGRSEIVGKPVAILLLNENATVTIAHSKTENLSQLTKLADILVVAVGKPGIITKDMVKKDSIVIDVGTTKKDGKLKGDVDFDNVKDISSFITPVPKGVGPMTVSFLISNTIKAAYNIEADKEE